MLHAVTGGTQVSDLAALPYETEEEFGGLYPVAPLLCTHPYHYVFVPFCCVIVAPIREFAELRFRMGKRKTAPN